MAALAKCACSGARACRAAVWGAKKRLGTLEQLMHVGSHACQAGNGRGGAGRWQAGHGMHAAAGAGQSPCGKTAALSMSISSLQVLWVSVSHHAIAMTHPLLLQGHISLCVAGAQPKSPLGSTVTSPFYPPGVTKRRCCCTCQHLGTNPTNAHVMICCPGWLLAQTSSPLRRCAHDRLATCLPVRFLPTCPRLPELPACLPA